jgi:glyoxylase-like metal-dependent hydrolase (beta-lactamase superfamily II)
MGSETFRFPLGKFSCVAIRDNGFRYPLAMFLTNLPREIYQPLLRERGEDLEQVDVPYTCLLIETGRERVLIDTGIGRDGAGPEPGRLLPLLRAEGVEPEEIGTVILSHAHTDHIGGNLTEEGNPAFPHAVYVMFQKEWDFWTSSPSLAELPVDADFKRKMLASVRNNVFPIRGQLDLLQRETEILPGISAIAAFGHSPGHMAVQISSEGQRLLFVADALIHPLNLPYPETRGVTDHDPEEMLATRLRLLEKAAREKCLVATSHFQFPGLGYVRPKGDRWEWEPVRVSTHPGVVPTSG